MAQCFLLWFEIYTTEVALLLGRHHRGLPKDWYYYRSWPDPFSWARIVTGSLATTLKASTLAEMGGYDPKMSIGEDLFLGNAISILRSTENDEQGNPKPNLSTIKTISIREISHPRRFLSMLRRTGEYESFKEKEFEE